MKKPVVAQIYPLLFEIVTEHARNKRISSAERDDMVWFLSSRGFYAVNRNNREEYEGFWLGCKEFVEDYYFVRSLEPNLPRLAVNNIVAAHVLFSKKLLIEYILPVSKIEAIVLLIFAVKKKIRIFNKEHGANGKITDEIIQFVRAYLSLKRCLPSESEYKICSLAV